MAISRLTQEHLPAFIFLTDQIIEYDFNSERAETGNIFKIIASYGPGSNDGTIVHRTVRRAFNLRKNLSAGKIVTQDYNLPEIKTLNTLTYFHYEKKSPTRFKILEKEYRKDIEEHYKNNRPSDEIIALIFEKRPEKLDFLDKKKDDLEDLVIRITERKLDGIKEELEETKKRFEEFQARVNDDIQLQNSIIAHLRSEIAQIQSKRKHASLIYRFFGSLGLFLVPIDYNEATLGQVLEDFMDHYEGLDLDDVLDDLV